VRVLGPGGLDRVVEGPNHSRDIFQRTVLQPPFAKGSGRLSLEVDQNESVSCSEDLSEMVVAMDPDLVTRVGRQECGELLLCSQTI
jgi:hypothetical protein